MLENIKKIVEIGGYNKIIVNIDKLHLYYMMQNNDIYIVSIVDMLNGDEFTKDQYFNILEQIKAKFSNADQITVLNIFYTKDVQVGRDFLESEGSNWILDSDSGKLIVYESHNNYFEDLRGRIEDYLYSGHISHRPINRKKTASEHVSLLKRYFSVCNSIILGLNILIFLIVELTGSSLNTLHMLNFGALHWGLVIQKGEFYRIFTYMFLHFGISHLVNNMIVLAFVGDNLERAVGKVKYLIIYFGSGIIAGIVSLSYNMINGNNTVSAGASGAIFGVVGAMVYVVAINKGRLEDISTRQLVLFVIFSFYGGLTSQGIDNAAHIGGFIAGVLLSVLLYRKPKKREVYSG